MSANPNFRRFSYVALCCLLVIVILVFGRGATYTPTAGYSLSFFLFAVVCLAVWTSGVSALTAGVIRSRQLAVISALTLAPWALFSFLPGAGTPQDATASQNQLRYVLLTIDAMAVTGA